MKKVFIGYGLFPLFTKANVNSLLMNNIDIYEIREPSKFCVRKPINKSYKKIKITVETIERRKRGG